MEETSMGMFNELQNSYLSDYIGRCQWLTYLKCKVHKEKRLFKEEKHLRAS